MVRAFSLRKMPGKGLWEPG